MTILSKSIAKVREVIAELESIYTGIQDQK
jgi:hypothetical protein